MNINAQITDITDPFEGLPRRCFAAVLADCPWSFKARTAFEADKPGRRVERHYPVMDIAAIKALPVEEVVAKDAHLFLWTTGPMLPWAFQVINAWGFTYSGVAFTWIKLKKSFQPAQLRLVPTADCDLHVGLGFTTRKNAEFCLLGRRGSPKRVARDVREVILAPVREHSRKPDEAYARVERYCTGPYLDLFSRQDRPGWTSWGAEAGKFK